MNNKLGPLFVYTKVFVLLTFFCFIGMWSIDKIFSVYGWNIDFLTFLILTTKYCAGVFLVFLPVDLVIYLKRR